MSRYSTSAKNFGSTQVAFGFLMGLVNFDLLMSWKRGVLAGKRA
jgi:hypothetical protein